MNDDPRNIPADEDLSYIHDLLKATLRNPNTCVSKGQLKKVAEQLLARNVLLENSNMFLRGRIDQLSSDLTDNIGADTPEAIREIRTQLAILAHRGPNAGR